MSALQLRERHVVLCEGAADRRFLRALRERRGLPGFDTPFPPKIDPKDGKPRHSLAGFVNMLNDLRVEIALLAAPTQGIVIVADAGDAPDKTLESIQHQCVAAGFAMPDAVQRWSESRPPVPAVAVILVPAGGQGGLETLCLQALRPLHPQVAGCVDSFMACVPPVLRTAEKRDKAAMACFTAALERDPTMTLARAFDGNNPLIDVTDPVFDSLATAIDGLIALSTPTP